MKLSKNIFALIGVCVLLAGCGLYHAPYRSDTSHPIRTITVARDVPMPKQMQFVGQSEMLEYAGAAGAGLVAGGKFQRSAGNYYGVPESVRSEFAAAIQKTGKFVVKNEGPADAELRLEVGGYGFNASAPFARRVNPVLSVRAKLVRPDGSVVWSFRTEVTHLSSGTPAVLPEEIQKDPEVGAHAFRVAARLIAQKAADTLQK
jgi:hypothetical protein